MKFSIRYIPQNSTEVTKEDLPVIAYTYTANSGKPGAIAYVGKSNKPAFHYTFKSDEQRTQHINELFETIAKREAYKAEQKIAKKAFRHTITAGEILYSSWGYEQTNVEFYEVIAVTEKTVTFREIAQNRTRTGHDTGNCSPVRGQFINDQVFTRPVKACGNNDTKGMVKFAESKGDYMKCLWVSDRETHYFSDGY